MQLKIFGKKLELIWSSIRFRAPSDGHPVCYHPIVGLALAMALNVVVAAPPSPPQTASEIERALGGASSAPQPPLQLRGAPGSSSPGVGRLRGPAGIVDDPVPAQATPSQPVKPPATLNYPDLIRDRPKIAALIHFDVNSARIRAEAYPLLNEYVAALKSATLANATLLIAGHTDAAGSDEYNLILSGKRAQAVREYLIERGIAPDRLIAKGYGEEYPVASNATEAGRDANRRSEFIRLDASKAGSP